MKNVTAILAVGVLFSLPAARLDAAEKIKSVQEWSGLIKDDALRKEAPTQVATDYGYITDGKAWAKLWKAWRGEEKLPKVDFDKEVVLIVTARGPNKPYPGVAQLNDKGDLGYGCAHTKIGGPGFGYRIAVFPRKGIKTISGKPLAKD